VQADRQRDLWSFDGWTRSAGLLAFNVIATSRSQPLRQLFNALSVGSKGIHKLPPGSNKDTWRAYEHTQRTCQRAGMNMTPVLG